MYTVWHADFLAHFAEWQVRPYRHASGRDTESPLYASLCVSHIAAQKDRPVALDLLQQLYGCAVAADKRHRADYRAALLKAAAGQGAVDVWTAYTPTPHDARDLLLLRGAFSPSWMKRDAQGMATPQLAFLKHVLTVRSDVTTQMREQLLMRYAEVTDARLPMSSSAVHCLLREGVSPLTDDEIGSFRSHICATMPKGHQELRHILDALLHHHDEEEQRLMSTIHTGCSLM